MYFIYHVFFSQGYITNAAYAKSKLAQIMLTKYYNKELSNTNVRVLAVHPGVVNTELFNGTLLKMTAPWILRFICKVIFLKNIVYSFLFNLTFTFRPQKKGHEVLLMLVFLQN